MRTVILRDDDTNALTPPDCLEALYRPFLARGLPINLAVIPEVRTDLQRRDRRPEGFLYARRGGEPATLPIGANPELVRYLQANPGLRIAQHGCFHDWEEFAGSDPLEVERRVELGGARLHEAGLGPAAAFIAPYDQISATAAPLLARRFRVISTGWFEWRRLPAAWLPRYALRKLTGAAHWSVNGTRLLSHPGCLLSHDHPLAGMLDAVKRAIESQEVTVLVTHWWEYFDGGVRNDAFIAVLHALAGWLAEQRDLRVIGFDELAR